MSNERRVYDCDTNPYWCSEEDYNNRDKKFGKFIENGSAYEITDRNTPRPWLNYLCNDKFASVISNDGLGFTFYKSSLLRITKYEHPIDYLPRDFQDGREIILTDRENGRKINVFRDAENVTCIHRPGETTLKTSVSGHEITFTLFVPVNDSAECWMVDVRNISGEKKNFEISFQQTWTFSKFGIHTADEGIPYLSVPGEDLEIQINDNKILAHSVNKTLPVQLYGFFFSPQAENALVETDTVMNKNREFKFKICRLNAKLDGNPDSVTKFSILSGADEDFRAYSGYLEKYKDEKAFNSELTAVREQWKKILDLPSCSIPEKDMQNFLNIWLKNQLFLTFRFVRSGYIGYRDTLQDSWGYSLIDIQRSRKQLLRTLSHMMIDGSCPRNYAPFAGEKADLRKFMDSGTWIPMALCDYIKESGDFAVLYERIPYLDSEETDTVKDHVIRAMDLLFSQRGRHGLCLTGDGDWNDALEGISKAGDAESAWLTMALFHALNLTAGLFDYTEDREKALVLRNRAEEIREILNREAWDGDWYVYGFTGSGKPIGSKTNKEGKIHLNAQTWAIFTGLSDAEKTEKMRKSVSDYLDTPLGPVLMMPPYVDEAAEVGRIADLEPGTFENASIYQHAVTFKIYSDITSGHYEDAVNTFVNLLPTNPENFDARRSSEPYCMGNYYCGPAHARFGQNFFTWFTGNPAWLLKIGFDEICGVKAEYDGLKIEPKVPASWNEFAVKRIFRDCIYNISFTRTGKKSVTVDGREISGNLITPTGSKTVMVNVNF